MATSETMGTQTVGRKQQELKELPFHRGYIGIMEKKMEATI